MPLRLQVDPGGEKYLSFARGKLEQMKRFMRQSGLKVQSKHFFISTSEHIWIKSLHVGFDTFLDWIRITAGEFVLIIDADTATYSVYDQFVMKYGAPPNSVRLLVIVRPDVEVLGATGVAAITWGSSWIGTPKFTFRNAGRVLGIGGSGGSGGNGTAPFNTAGSSGSNAIELSGQSVSIDNESGFIWGGGGGGGGANGERNDVAVGTDQASATAGGGAGGGGAPYGLGGAFGIIRAAAAVQPCGISIGNSITSASGSCGSAQITALSGSGTAATLDTPGVGGGGGASAATSNVVGSVSASGADGGVGGAPGEGGATAGGIGGAAGKAISLSGGTATFTSGAADPNVKGAVS